MNYQSQPLQLHEIKSMTSDSVIMNRLRKSYSLMLDFYGMEIDDPKTGLVSRSESYKNRYRHLASKSLNAAAACQTNLKSECLSDSFHNYLRISRILKCLSEMGLEKLNIGLLLHILNEQSEHNNLNTPRLRSSMDQWWINCIRDDQERKWLNDLVAKVRNDDFFFGRRLYELALENRRASGSLSLDLQQEPEYSN